MHFFQVKQLVLCDQTELEMSQYATNVTKEDPIINDLWWTNVSMDTCLSGESRLVEQVQQEGQFYPHQQASNRAPMPGSTLVLHAGHAETWKLLPLQFFTVVSYQTKPTYFIIMSQNLKTKQSHISCITNQSHMSYALKNNENTAVEGRHLDIP